MKTNAKNNQVAMERMSGRETLKWMAIISAIVFVFGGILYLAATMRETEDAPASSEDIIAAIKADSTGCVKYEVDSVFASGRVILKHSGTHPYDVAHINGLASIADICKSRVPLRLSSEEDAEKSAAQRKAFEERRNGL